MPISYNPGIQDISGQLFAQNAAPGFAALSRGIQDRQEANERDLKNAQIAESVVKNNPDMLQQLGMTEEEFKLLPGREKFNRVTGATMAMGAQQERQKISAQMREYAARAAAENQKSGYYNQLQAQDKAEGEAFNTFGRTLAGTPRVSYGEPPTVDPNTMLPGGTAAMMQPGAGTPAQLPQPPPTPDSAPGGMPALPRLSGMSGLGSGPVPPPLPAPRALPGLGGGPGTLVPGKPGDWNQAMAAALQTPGLAGRSAPKLFEEMAKYSPKAGAPQFTTAPDGSVVATMGNNMHVIKPTLNAIRPVPVQLNGETVGYQIGDKFHTAADIEGVPEDVTPEPVTDSNGKTIPNMWRYKDRNGKIKILKGPAENPLAALFAGAGAGAGGAVAQPVTAAAKPAAVPVIKTKAEYAKLPSGTEFIQGGKRFTKP